MSSSYGFLGRFPCTWISEDLWFLLLKTAQSEFYRLEFFMCQADLILETILHGFPLIIANAFTSYLTASLFRIITAH